MALTDIRSYPAWSLPQRRRRPRLIERLWTWWRARKAQRETIRLLSSVDTATLRDLGISPGEIESLVYGDSRDRLRGYDPDWWRVGPAA